jgi:hypothetical protein
MGGNNALADDDAFEGNDELEENLEIEEDDVRMEVEMNDDATQR